MFAINCTINRINTLEYKNNPWKALEKLELFRKVNSKFYNNNEITKSIDNKIYQIDMFINPVDDI